MHAGAAALLLVCASAVWVVELSTSLESGLKIDECSSVLVCTVCFSMFYFLVHFYFSFFY